MSLGNMPEIKLKIISDCELLYRKLSSQQSIEHYRNIFKIRGKWVKRKIIFIDISIQLIIENFSLITSEFSLLLLRIHLAEFNVHLNEKLLLYHMVLTAKKNMGMKWGGP